MKVGDIVTKRYRIGWRECQVCGKPASFKITYLAGENPRGNPASSAFGKDDCTWCSDAETFACRKHKREVAVDTPIGMRQCAIIPLSKFKHIGFYKVDYLLPSYENPSLNKREKLRTLREVAHEELKAIRVIEQKTKRSRK